MPTPPGLAFFHAFKTGLFMLPVIPLLVVLHHPNFRGRNVVNWA